MRFARSGLRPIAALGAPAIVGALGAFALPARADLPAGSLLANASFESPALAEGGFQVSGSIPGWVATNACGVEVDNDAFGKAFDGGQCVELNADCVGGVAQAVPTEPGASYVLSFAFAARPGTAADQNRVRVSFDGALLDDVGPVAPAPSGGLDWTMHRYEVTATSSSTALRFEGGSLNAGDAAGSVIDAVSLVPRVLSAAPFTRVDGAGLLFAAACAGPGACFAVGADSTFSASLFVPFHDGVAGKAQEVAGADTLVDAACATAESCFAVGVSGGAGVIVPIVGGAPGDAQIVPGAEVINRITCASPSLCVGMGLTSSEDSPNRGLVAVVVPIVDGVAGPAQIVPGTSALQANLSCPTPTFCLAAGLTDSIEGVVVPIVNGAAGAAQVVAGAASFFSTACPDATTCLVGGISLSNQGVVVPVTNGVAGPVQPLAGAGGVAALACTDAASCVGVGDQSPAVGNGYVVPIVNGVAGPVQAVPGTSGLFNVECSTSCLASGALEPGNIPLAIDPPPAFVLVPIADGAAGPPQYVGGGMGIFVDMACHASECVAVGGGLPERGGGFAAVGPGATPAITTSASGPVAAGGFASGAATVSGGFAPTGEVTFSLYGPGDADCSTPLSTTTAPLGPGGTASSGPVSVGAAGTYNWVATYSGDTANRPVSSACGDEPFEVTPHALTGRAYGLTATASLLGLNLVNIAPAPDTGSVNTTADSNTSPPCVAGLSGPVSASGLCASVTTEAFPGRSDAEAEVAEAAVAIATLPVITIGAARASSSTTCEGSSGTTTISFLKVGTTVVIGGPTAVPPDTRVNVGAVSLFLNEQTPVAGPDAGLAVNAVRINVNALGLAAANVAVASAESGVGNCP